MKERKGGSETRKLRRGKRKGEKESKNMKGGEGKRKETDAKNGNQIRKRMNRGKRKR